jgi:hypothetical protein
MSTQQQIANVKEKLHAALNGARQELTKVQAGEPGVSSERELLIVVAGLEHMLSGLAESVRPEAPGLGRIVIDTWPCDSALAESVLEAEYAYKKLK